MCARHLCSVQPSDIPEALALRALHSICRSVEDYCSINQKNIPKETKKVADWLNRKGGSGYELGLEILGFGGSFGRQVEVPAVTDITFEGLTDVITCVISEVVNKLDMAGVFLALDNIENLEDEQLSSLLMTFRDTLFTIPRLWWVVIGQSGLGSLVQTLDPRVSDRLVSSGLELEPISLQELHVAIERRVARFHAKGSGKAPLPSPIHNHLYSASHGEIRFVFKYSHSICAQFISNLRKMAIKRMKERRSVGKFEEGKLDELLGEFLIEEQVPEDYANDLLREIITAEIRGLNLRSKDKQILTKIGETEGARAKDYQTYGLRSMQDFSSNYLSKFFKQHLLARRQEGRAVLYTLRGIVALAAEFGLLSN
jgi:hypothetical protein